MKLKKIAPLAILAVAGSAFGQTSQDKPNALAVQAGVFFPSNGVIRDIFGSSTFRLGLDTNPSIPSPDWKVTGAVAFFGSSSGGSRFLAIPFGFSVQRAFGERSGATVPFVKLGAGLAYYDYDITSTTFSARGRKFGVQGSAEVGVQFSQAFRLSAQYNAFSKVDGIDFSGFSINASLTVLRF